MNLMEIIEKYDIQVMAMQETKIKGNGITNFGKCTMFNSNVENRLLGTGFLVQKSIKSKVLDFKAISERVCMLRVIWRYRNLWIINAHAPAEEKNLKDKENFYENLESLTVQISKYDVKIVAGEFNAKVKQEEGYRKVTGRKGQKAE